MNGGANHSANHGSGDRLHHVSADTIRPGDRNQAGENRIDRHQLRTEPLYNALNRGLVNIGVCKRLSCRDALIERWRYRQFRLLYAGLDLLLQATIQENGTDSGGWSRFYFCARSRVQFHFILIPRVASLN